MPRYHEDQKNATEEKEALVAQPPNDLIDDGRQEDQAREKKEEGRQEDQAQEKDEDGRQEDRDQEKIEERTDAAKTK